ncbi:hydrogenase maturation peptidase HycI [Candidatus Margulisiibacteriota bacterium]
MDVLRAEGKLVVLTIGNTLKSDDGVGPYIGKEMEPRLSVAGSIVTLNAGNKPEAFVGKVIESKPAKVVIIDAVHFGGKPGETRIIKKEQLPAGAFDTHSIPLKMIAKMIEDESKAPVYILGIQPKSVDLGEELSDEVKEAADKIVECLYQND